MIRKCNLSFSCRLSCWSVMYCKRSESQLLPLSRHFGSQQLLLSHHAPVLPWWPQELLTDGMWHHVEFIQRSYELIFDDWHPNRTTQQRVKLRGRGLRDDLTLLLRPETVTECKCQTETKVRFRHVLTQVTHKSIHSDIGNKGDEKHITVSLSVYLTSSVSPPSQSLKNHQTVIDQMTR